MNNYIDKNINKILKFHQSSLNVVGYKDSIISYPPTINDYFLEKYKIDTFQGIRAKLLNFLKNCLENLNPLITMPIIVISGDVYSFDFLNNQLLKYKTTELINDAEISISLFLELEKSLLIYKNSAYQEGLLQIGGISQTITNFCKENNLNIIEKFIINQKFTHELGINLRKQLLIKNIFIKGF